MRAGPLSETVSGGEAVGAVKNPSIVVRALRTVQGENVPVYSFFLRGSDIVRIADISRLHRDERESLKGFQRPEIQNHVRSIAEFLDRGPVLFPNAIILALAPEVEFRQARGPVPNGLLDIGQMGTLMIPIADAGSRVAWIVDGQQRSLALARSRKGDIPVPVIAFVSADLQTQREQFILVNKAKPLSMRLIDELLPEIGAQLPRDLSARRIPSELCTHLNRDPKSPFHNLIKRASGEAKASAVIIDTSLVNVLKNSMNNPLGALSGHRLSDGSPDINAMYVTVCQFWSAVRDAFPDAWGKLPSRSRLMHSAGIQAMGFLMDRIMTRLYGAPDPVAGAREALGHIAPKCHWTSGTWEGIGLAWDEIQTVPRHIKALAETLIRLDAEALRLP